MSKLDSSVQIDSSIQAQVDAQVMEQGAYTTLDFLIDTGRLVHSDYESWRRGDIEVLDEVLMGARQKIKAQIAQAADYARRIGLVEQAQTFHAWRNPLTAQDDKPLRISKDAQFERLIAARYAPARSVPQMDLFFDNPVAALIGGIVRSLSTLNLGEAQRQLDRLYAQAPNHADLPAFDRLTGALERLDRPVAEARAELAFLQEITPIAKRLLGSQTRDLLAPLWRRLADALSGHAFSPDETQLHSSYALVQAQDWIGVSECVHAEPEWRRHATLCLYLAQSSFFRQQRIESLTGWFHACWCDPESVARALNERRQADVGMGSAWNRFRDNEDDSDLADEQAAFSASDFPAWMLLNEPGLALQLPHDLPTNSTPGEERYRLVHGWIQARRAHCDADELALRKAIQASSPLLFRVLKRSI